MQTYHVAYKMVGISEEKSIDVVARNKAEAYEKAVYDAIFYKEQSMPYSAWVVSVTYNNGNHRVFNTSEGNSY